MQFIFKKIYFSSGFLRSFGLANYRVKLHEINELISIGTASVQRNLLGLKPFIYGNSRIFPKVFLASTSALFFPLRWIWWWIWLQLISKIKFSQRGPFAFSSAILLSCPLLPRFLLRGEIKLTSRPLHSDSKNASRSRQNRKRKRYPCEKTISSPCFPPSCVR